tara:strand:- start:33 stop:299 length:267 start_codon:yes stop_codon:yes gene_type:complete
MITLIKSILKSLELYLSLKNKTFYLKLVKDHEKERKSIIQEIEDIRTNRGDADRADLLREQLIRKDRDFEHLSAIYSKSQKRVDNPNN